VRAPLSWLREFTPLDHAPAEIAATLDDLGLVVEDVVTVGEGLEDVVLARVLEIGAIKGADRIRRVVVDAGGEPVEVVCGAWNFSVGDVVPLAPVGAVLSGELRIARRKMRGVTSNGMLCSASELGLGHDHAGILVLDEVEGAVPGQLLRDVLGIDRDVVFDLSVEGDRPDAWCIAGVARNLAARLRLPFSLPEIPAVARSGTPITEVVTVSVGDADLAPRVTARLLTGVSVAPSPTWLARRITMAGMRPVNNVVDVSNYVMLELGQPTHPYDLDRLGAPGLVVRRARPGERVTTLDGVERTLGLPGPGIGDDGRDCVICDAADQPVGIGGIMGGASSEITDTTTTVLVETAYFAPLAVARTATRLALRTEASARFERGCDPWGIDAAIDRFCGLLDRAGGLGSVAPGDLDVRGDVPVPITVELPVERVNALLGTALGPGEVTELLTPLGFTTDAGQVGRLAVTVPTARPDVRPAPFGVADLIEEVARLHGYARLGTRRPAWPQPGLLTRRQRERRTVREVMVGLGAFEAWTPSIVDPQDHAVMGLDGAEVTVANPQVAEERALRRSLLPGLLRALGANGARRNGAVRLFEVGTVFAADPPAHAPREHEMAAILLGLEGDDGPRAVVSWRALAEALRVAEVSMVGPLHGGGAPRGLHPTRCAELRTAGGSVVGAVGEVDAQVAEHFGATGVGVEGDRRRLGWVEVDLDLLLDPAVVARRAEGVVAPSRYPAADVDLAIVVDDSVPVDAVERVLVEAGEGLVEQVGLFDVFRGPGVAPGCRSLGFHLRFSAPDRTLDEAAVAGARAACIDAVTVAFGAQLR